MDLAESGSFQQSQRWICRIYRGAGELREPKRHVIVHVILPCSVQESKSSPVIEIARWPGQNLSTCSTRNGAIWPQQSDLVKQEVIPILFSPCSVVGRAAEGGVHLVCSAGRSISSGAFPPSDVIQQRLCPLLHHSRDCDRDRDDGDAND